MSEMALGQLLWLLFGVALGAAGALTIAWHRGAFNPVVKVTVALRGTEAAPIESAVVVDEQNVTVRPIVLVNWDVIYRAAEGAGMAVVPADMAPPKH